jgi:hypothetical protein
LVTDALPPLFELDAALPAFELPPLFALAAPESLLVTDALPPLFEFDAALPAFELPPLFALPESLEVVDALVVVVDALVVVVDALVVVVDALVVVVDAAEFLAFELPRATVVGDVLPLSPWFFAPTAPEAARLRVTTKEKIFTNRVIGFPSAIYMAIYKTKSLGPGFQDTPR